MPTPEPRHKTGAASTQIATPIILGASGSVGRALVSHALQQKVFADVVILVRQPQPGIAAEARAVGVRLHEKVVPTMTPQTLEAATHEVMKALGGRFVGLCVLGVGAGTAKITYQAHRAIDVELPAAFARALKDSGQVGHLGLMSAVGADAARASTGHGAPGLARYARVKGEAEEAARAQGPAVVSIFRPAMILGSVHTPWLLAKVAPAFNCIIPSTFRSISVHTIAKAMLATARKPPLISEIYHYGEMMQLSQTWAQKA